MRVRVSSKGQIVLPAEIRRKYGIEAGSELDVVEWAGTLYLLPVEEGEPLDRLRGMLVGAGYSTEQFLAERRAERDAEGEEHRTWMR